MSISFLRNCEVAIFENMSYSFVDKKYVWNCSPIPEHSGLSDMSSIAMSPRKRIPLLPINCIEYLETELNRFYLNSYTFNLNCD